MLVLLLLWPWCHYKKKKEKSRIEYDIWWSKNWILNEKNYSVDDMFIRCIYV